jgi:glutaminyl-peptide cyclotransferase
MSDGSSVLRFLDPETLETVGRVRVKAAGGDVLFLNELEYVAGEIWANVWLTSRICRIDPSNGEVLGWIDLSELAAEEPQKNPGADVLNGIAYDPDTGRIVVTGKLWSSVYEIVLIQPED